MVVRIPDILCYSRMFGSILLLVTVPLSLPYLAVYGYCRLSDVLDGYIARHTDGETTNGQILDSTADMILMICLVTSLLVYLEWETWMIVWMAIIACIRIMSLGIGSSRFGHLALLHTYGNKFSGLLITIAPFIMPFADLSDIMMVLCIVAMIASLEDLYINCRSSTLNRNIRSFLDMGRDPDRQ